MSNAVQSQNVSTDPQRVRTGEFRLSFPFLFKPRPAQDGGKPKFTADLLFPKNETGKASVAKINKAIEAAAAEKWGPKEKQPKNLKLPFKDGDTKQDLVGYPGHYVVSTSSTKAPGIVNQRKERLDEKNHNTDELYAGCYCHADLRAYAWEVSGNRGISLSLENLQKIRNGEPFSGRKDPEQVFDVIASDEDDAGSSAAVDNSFPF